MTYYCENCNRLVYADDVRYEDEISTGYVHRICPCCGTEDELIEADECVICGDPIRPDSYMCPSCEDELRTGLNELMDSLGCSPTTFQESVDWLWMKDEEKEWKGFEF